MKAIALDMDGTVLNNKGELSNRLRDVFYQINQKGIKIIFATGRTQTEILNVTPSEIPLAGYVAASGMSVFIDDELVKARTFNKNTVLNLLKEARAHEIYYETFTATTSARTLKEDKNYSLRDFVLKSPTTLMPYEEILMNQTIHSDTQWVDTLDYNNIIKVFFISKALKKIDAWHDYLTTKKDYLGCALYRTSRHNCEVMLSGDDKSTGLKTILDHYNIAFKDVHAFGDSMNDLPMFETCGKSTAVKGSHPDIIKASNDITDFTNDEDGIADYLEKHYL